MNGVSYVGVWETLKMSKTYTTICLRPSRGFLMNLRVRRVTSAMFATVFVLCWTRSTRSWKLEVVEFVVGRRDGCGAGVGGEYFRCGAFVRSLDRV